MVGQRRAPGVQHGGEADPGAEMLRVGRDGEERLGGGPEQQVVDHGLVLEGDRRDRRRQGEDDVVVGHGQQIGLPLREPGLRAACALALAGNAGCGRSCRRSSTWSQSSQRATWPPSAAVRQARIAEMTLSWPRLRCPRWRATIGIAMRGEDVRDLQMRPRHESARTVYGGGGGASSASGLVTSRIVFRATRV